MSPNRREFLLKAIAFGIVGLFLLDRFVVTPSIEGWKAQTERLAVLKERVARGRGLIDREQSLRSRWAEMLNTDLNEDVSLAENDVFKAIGRWASNSRISFTSFNPSWRDHPQDGYDTYECRATATGDQAAIGRLLYEIETDPLPARVEECEISTRDAQGKQLSMTVKVTFVRIAEGGPR